MRHVWVERIDRLRKGYPQCGYPVLILVTGMVLGCGFAPVEAVAQDLNGLPDVPGFSEPILADRVETLPVVGPAGEKTGQQVYTDCPTALLREAWQEALPQTALETFAVEQEVLRLCDERQTLINRIVERDAKLVDLLNVARTRRETITRGVDPPPQRNLIGHVEASQDDFPMGASENAMPGEGLRSDPDLPDADEVVYGAPAGNWEHLVRYRVRVAQGVWQANISSIHTPAWDPPVSVTAEDGTTTQVSSVPPEPNDPVYQLVAAGDVLPDGLVVSEVTPDGVKVREAQDTVDMGRLLRNDPGQAPVNRAQVEETCPVGNADARDLISCKVVQ